MPVADSENELNMLGTVRISETSSGGSKCDVQAGHGGPRTLEMHGLRSIDDRYILDETWKLDRLCKLIHIGLLLVPTFAPESLRSTWSCTLWGCQLRADQGVVAKRIEPKEVWRGPR